MTREGYRWQSRSWRPSDSQARVLDGLARGLTNAEIAAEVGLTLDGVKWHVSRALSETGLSDRQSLARWWQGGPLRMSIGEARATSNEGGDEPLFLDYGSSMRAMAASFDCPDLRDPSWRVLRPAARLSAQSLLMSRPVGRPIMRSTAYSEEIHGTA